MTVKELAAAVASEKVYILFSFRGNPIEMRIRGGRGDLAALARAIEANPPVYTWEPDREELPPLHIVHMVQHEQYTLVDISLAIFSLVETISQQDDCDKFGITPVNMEPFFYTILMQKNAPTRWKERINAAVALKMPLSDESTKTRIMKMKITDKCREALFPVKTAEIGYNSLTLRAFAAVWVVFAVCITLAVIAFIGEKCVAWINGANRRWQTDDSAKTPSRHLLSFDVAYSNDDFLRRLHELIKDCDCEIILKD